MARNLDLVALRSLVAVAETGGVTRAAGAMNLTQSAVSMQIKRLEEALGQDLLDRSGRGVSLSAAGEQLLGYARRLIALNDEAVMRLAGTEFEGELVLGVPHDIVYPSIPQVLKRFAAEYPRMRVRLLSLPTVDLKAIFAEGGADVVVTTENVPDAGADVLDERALVWMGAPGGVAWRARPLRLAFERNCIFRAMAQDGLDAAGIPWEQVVDSNQTRSCEATVSADLAVIAQLEGTMPVFETVPHRGALPDLGSVRIALYTRAAGRGRATDDLIAMVRSAFRPVPVALTA